MGPEEEQFTIRHGMVVNWDVARFAAHPVVGPDNVVGARVLVMTEAENWVDARISETFQVRDQVWRLDAVEILGVDDYRIRISRVS